MVVFESVSKDEMQLLEECKNKANGNTKENIPNGKAVYDAYWDISAKVKEEDVQLSLDDYLKD